MFFLAGLYYFLKNNGFSQETFLSGAVIFLIASLISIFIVISDILDKKQEHNKKLMHLVKETLHEINLPLATIDGNIKMILKNLDTKNSIRANRIISAAKRLKRLYDKLSYTIKKDIMPIEKKEFNLKNLIEELINSYIEIFGDRFNLDLKDLNLKTDKMGLEQAIENIITNALKYSDKKIDIKIKDNLLIIKDYGKGMDANELLKIYDRYYQGDKSYKGSGIGLSVVKEFCDNNKIEIKINSTPNIGTTVILDFNKIKI